MNAAGCPNERDAVEAARSGEWTPELAAHLGECMDCADLALVGGMLRMTEAPPDLLVDLSEARLIWSRADGERRRQREAQALLPVMIGELAACLFGGVALIGLAANFFWPLSEGLGATGQRLLADPVVASLAPVIGALSLGVAAVSLVLAIGFRAVRS
jgi:hypothetical protein